MFVIVGIYSRVTSFCKPIGVDGPLFCSQHRGLRFGGTWRLLNRGFLSNPSSKFKQICLLMALGLSVCDAEVVSIPHSLPNEAYPDWNFFPCDPSFACHEFFEKPCYYPQRFGEATHPGPELVKVTIGNVTSIQDRIPEIIAQWGSGYHCLAETSATKVTLKNARYQAIQRKFDIYPGRVVPPLTVTKKGIDSVRGQCKGVAVLTDLFYRPMQHIDTFTAWESHRLTAGYIRFGSFDVLLITAYFFQKNHENAVALNKEIHSQIFQIVSQWHGPSIVTADFNCDIGQTTLFRDGYQKFGFEDVRTIHRDRNQGDLAPTCVESSVTETVLITRELVPHLVKAEVVSTDIFPTHSPMHVYFDSLVMPVPRFQWQLPKPLPVAHLTTDHLEFCLLSKQDDWEQSFDEAIEQGSTDDVFRVWSQNAEDCFQHAVEFQHLVDPSSFPQNRIGPRSLGRGTCPKRVPVNPFPHILKARNGDFNPSYDPVTKVAKQKAKQVRRIESLARKISYQIKHGKDIRNGGNQKEWKAIISSAGYGKSFVDWMLACTDTVAFPIEWPDENHIQTILQVTRDDCQRFCRNDYTRRIHNFKQSLIFDWESKGGKKTFDIIADRNFHTFNAMLVPKCVPVIRSKWIRKGVLRLRFDQPCKISPHDECFYNKGQIRCISCHDTYADFQWPHEVGSPPQSFVIEIHSWTRQPDEMAQGWFQYWSEFWEKDPSADTEENWFSALDTIRQVSKRDEFKITIDENDLRDSIKRTPKRSARGLCGWHIQEIALLPSFFIQQLVRLFEICCEQDWPDVFSQVRVSLPPKNDNPCRPKDGRPICIFSQVYRIIAKVLARKIAAQFATWMPPAIVGGLPQRDASDIFYTIQFRIEQSIRSKSPLFGFCLDIQKCYNALSRIPLLATLRHLGVDGTIVKVWAKLLKNLRRTVCLAGSFSELRKSTCGIAEGDPLAVPAMTAVCYLWYHLVDPTSAFAYADNWELLTDQFPDLCEAISKTCAFLDAWKLKPDINKSWAWSSNKLSKQHQSQVIDLVASYGTLPWVNQSADLGANIRYKRVMKIGPIRERFERAATRASRLHVLKLPPELLGRALLSGSLSLVRHASEICAIGLKWYDELRSTYADVLCSNQSNRNPWLACATAYHEIIDPELKMIKHCFRSARTFLFKFPEHQSTFIHLLISLPGGAFSSHGPVGCLKRWLIRLNWKITDNGVIITQEGIALSLLASCIKEIYFWLDIAWASRITYEVQHRKGLHDLPEPNIPATSRALQKCPPPDHKIMIKYLSGAWTTGDKVAHWNPAESNCQLCGQQDTMYHRFFECPFTENLRSQHSKTLQLIQEHAPHWIYSPLIPRHPDERRWWQICSLPIDVPERLSVQVGQNDQFCAL